MNLNIKRVYLPVKEKRKIKLLRLKKVRVAENVGFDWSLTAENKEEEENRIQNFSLFCISIVKDLLKNKFETNENGKVRYNSKLKHKDNTLKDLQALFDCICKDIK